jgi:antitoxin component YwqK of YwqJK toxin-antitoxin module
MIKFRILSIALSLLVLSGCWKNDVGRSYYSSGKILTEATIRNGLLDGPSTMYYESGAKMSEAVYKSGLLSGTSISFYESGNKKAQADYKDGLLDGWSIRWNEEGIILSKVCFKAGHLIFEKVESDSTKECSGE